MTQGNQNINAGSKHQASYGDRACSVAQKSRTTSIINHELLCCRKGDFRYHVLNDIEAIVQEGFALLQEHRKHLFGLCDRKTQIIAAVAIGTSNSRLGTIRGISEFTLKNHMERLFRKLSAFNRAQAVSKVIGVAPHG